MSQSTIPSSSSAPRRGPPRWVKALAWTGAALMLWAVSSCAESTTSPPPAADPAVVAFGLALDSNGVPMARDPRMVDLGRSVCEALDVGVSPEQLGLSLSGGGNNKGWLQITPYQAGTIVRASVGAFCPRHQAAIDGS